MENKSFNAQKKNLSSFEHEYYFVHIKTFLVCNLGLMSFLISWIYFRIWVHIASSESPKLIFLNCLYFF